MQTLKLGRMVSLIIILVILMHQEEGTLQEIMEAIPQVSRKLRGFMANLQNESIIFLGATGSGKSALISCLLGAIIES